MLEVFQHVAVLARLGWLTGHETELCEQLKQVLTLSKSERQTPAQGPQFGQFGEFLSKSAQYRDGDFCFSSLYPSSEGQSDAAFDGMSDF